MLSGSIFWKFGLSSFTQKPDALRQTGDHLFWVWTESGQNSMKKESLPKMEDRFLLSMPVKNTITTFCLTILMDFDLS